MRGATVTQLKGGRRRAVLKTRPDPDSHLGEVYDLLFASKGEAISLSGVLGSQRAIADLTDYYGLDIRRVGRCLYVLAGEWCGRAYIDYVAERFERETAAGQAGGLS